MSNEPKSHDAAVALPRDVLMDILSSSTKELVYQRRLRYFGLFFKVAVFLGILGGGYFLGNKPLGFNQGDKTKPHVAFIEIYGPIMSGQLADADRLIPSIEEAFAQPLAKTVVLRINSPGGSPVHAGRVYNEITQLRAQYPDKRVYAVVEDLCASAAYYIASAADVIYVDQASLVGSIGVITEGFGFNKVMEQYGVERRVITSGEHKALLDPYSPADPKVTEYWKAMLGEIHQQFIASVKLGRGARLHADYPELFSGLIWTGKKSIDIGLADGLGSLSSVSRDTLGSVNTVNYTPPPDFLKQIANQTHAQLNAIKFDLANPIY